MCGSSICNIVVKDVRQTKRKQIISDIFWPGGGNFFLSQLKNREEFEGGLEKRKEKGEKEGKKEKSDKTHVKIPL